MESLLRWGIENSTGDNGQQQPIQPRKDLDPAIIDHILGKPDAVLMKEALDIAIDEKRDDDDRLQALEDFEMLVEHIDNANDLAKLRMWEPLQNLLTSPSSPDAIKRQVLWVVGTALQNNPSAQTSYLALNPLPTILAFLLPSVPSAKTRSKAVYALSGLLKHHAVAVRQLEESQGWEVLRGLLEDSDITVRRKAVFLINTLLTPTSPVESHPTAPLSSPPSSDTDVVLHPTVQAPEPAQAIVHPNSHASMISNPDFFSTSESTKQALEHHAILPALVRSLISPIPFGPDGDGERDADYEENVVRVLYTYLVSCQGSLSTEDKGPLATYLREESRKAGVEAQLSEKWNLTVDEIKSLRDAVE